MSIAERTIAPAASGVRRRTPNRLGVLFREYLTTTDHKRIGTLYFITSFVMFLIGGVLALCIRLELAEPGMQFMQAETFNQLFTMHGTRGKDPPVGGVTAAAARRPTSPDVPRFQQGFPPLPFWWPRWAGSRSPGPA